VDFDKLMKRESYTLHQLDKVKSALDFVNGDVDESPFPSEDCVVEWFNKSNLFEQILQQLKDRFNLCEKDSEKVQVLTVLPENWSVENIQAHFKTSVRMITKAKSLAKEKGIMSTPNKKGGKSLSPDIVKAVIEFYLREEVSRELPGKNDVVSIKENGEKVKKRKRLV